MTPPKSSHKSRGGSAAQPALDYSKPLPVLRISSFPTVAVAAAITPPVNKSSPAAAVTDIRVPKCSLASDVKLEQTQYEIVDRKIFATFPDGIRRELSLEDAADHLLTLSASSGPKAATTAAASHRRRTAAYAQHSPLSAIFQTSKAFGQHGLLYSLRLEDFMLLTQLALNANGITWTQLRWLCSQGVAPRNLPSSAIDESNYADNNSNANRRLAFARIGADGPRLIRQRDAPATLVPPLLTLLSLPLLLEYKMRQSVAGTVTDEAFAFLLNLMELMSGSKGPVAEEAAYAEASAQLGMLAPSERLFHVLYNYWRGRRMAIGRPLLRCFWPVAAVSDTSVFAVFRARARERMALRRMRRSTCAGANAVGSAAGNGDSLRKLLEAITKRDQLKLRVAEVEMALFQQLLRDVDGKYKLSSWPKFRQAATSELRKPTGPPPAKRYRMCTEIKEEPKKPEPSPEPHKSALQASTNENSFMAPVPLPPLCLSLDRNAVTEDQLKVALATVKTKGNSIGFVQQLDSTSFQTGPSGVPPRLLQPVYAQTWKALAPPLRHPANTRLVLPFANPGVSLPDVAAAAARTEVLSENMHWRGHAPNSCVGIRKGRNGRVWLQRD